MDILLVLIQLICFIIIIRSFWISFQRMKLNRFENNLHLIKNYLSFDEMMFRFWVWDIEKLKINFK